MHSVLQPEWECLFLTRTVSGRYIGTLLVRLSRQPSLKDGRSPVKLHEYDYCREIWTGSMEGHRMYRMIEAWARVFA